MSVGASGDHEPVPAEPKTTRPESIEPEPTMADPAQPHAEPTPWIDPTLPTYLPSPPHRFASSQADCVT